MIKTGYINLWIMHYILMAKSNSEKTCYNVENEEMIDEN